MTEKALASPKPPEIPIANNFKKVFRQHGGTLNGMVVSIILLSFISDSFLTTNNTTNIILQASMTAITAYGTTYVFLFGDIDLSVDSAIVLIGIFAVLGVSWGIPFVLLVPLSTIAVLALGMINGGSTAIAEIPLFIATVATVGIFRDIAYMVTDGMPIMIKDGAFLALGSRKFLYIPTPIWILIILLLTSHFIFTKITFGRKIYIIGGSKEAAIYSGVDITRLEIKVFMIIVVLAGISGMILTSRLYSGQPNSALSYGPDVVAAVVLGGTSLNGGYRTVMGATIGILTIGITNNDVDLMDAPYFYQMVVKELVILVAVYLDVRNRRERN